MEAKSAVGIETEERLIPALRSDPLSRGIVPQVIPVEEDKDDIVRLEDDFNRPPED